MMLRVALPLSVAGELSTISRLAAAGVVVHAERVGGEKCSLVVFVDCHADRQGGAHGPGSGVVVVAISRLPALGLSTWL